MATNPATKKQLDFLKQLTGKDYSDEELTASEASKKIEKALANKAEEVAKLPAQDKGKLLTEDQKIIDEALAEPIKHDKKDKAVALSYAKDLACHKIIGVADMPRWANQFLKYIEDK